MLKRFSARSKLTIARIAIFSTLVLTCMATARADEAPSVKIGEKAPDFSLSDQNGDETTLAALLKKGNVALVFYRSADW